MSYLSKVFLLRYLRHPLLSREVRVSKCNNNFCVHASLDTDDSPKNAINTEVPEPELDFSYLCEEKNKASIDLNIKKRKGVGNINRVLELHYSLGKPNSSSESIKSELLQEALLIPNQSHPDLQLYDDTPKVIREVNEKKSYSFKPKEFSNLVKTLNLMRTENMGVFSGHKGYYLLGDLAELEQALIKYSLQYLTHRGFHLMVVPDILPRQVIERCGMNTRGERNQVYELDPSRHAPDMILSGTSEMALAGFFMNRQFVLTDLPAKVMAVSRCYRAEISSIAEERGIYRVHQFTKVEMFCVTDQSTSDQLLEEFCFLQEDMFNQLGLHFQVLDMPLSELGAPAYRKYDIEAWMPGRNMYGEVSSCSNCTDFQSRRLNIKYSVPDGSLVHAHTINGTACAIPRMLISILETYQQDDGSIHIPSILHSFMKKKKITRTEASVPIFKPIRSKLAEDKIIESFK